EWAVISALGPTPVPVPEALGFCQDPGVTGAHFYVMSFVEGAPLYLTADGHRLLPLQRREHFAHSFIDVLADLHSIDPDEVGLGALGKKDGYIERQLKTWYRSWNASIDDARMDDPRAHALQQYFLDHLPEEGPARVVHGDYGTHNCLVGADGAVAAVLDWEISTLGDPLADLAYAMNQWTQPDDAVPFRTDAPTTLPGFPPRRGLIDRYAQRTGLDLSRLDYYVGFNRWKSAAIGHGVYARYLAGKKSSQGVDLDELRQRVINFLALAEQAVERLETGD
ncbi:MAG: phosphotransferase family protein, partial [Quisquiliibacterium sp.]